MALRTKSITSPRTALDGLRISVMSRHTLNDGITPDPAITPSLYDARWIELAPPPRLVGSYYRHELSWKSFELAFVFHLRQQPETQTALLQLAAASYISNITILCIEKTPERCHRRLIAEACRKINPLLKIIIE